MKLKYYFFFLMVLYISLFFIPCPKENFAAHYTKSDEVAKSLFSLQKLKLDSLNYNEKSWTYLKLGKGENTIVFIHGMSGTYYLWWQQIEALKSDYKIITVEVPKGISTLKEANEGVLNILDNEDVADFYLVGTSMGGYIAQYIMHNSPKRIKKIVLGNTFPPNDYIRENGFLKSKIAIFLPPILVYYLRNFNFENGMIASSVNPPLIRAYLYSIPFQKKQFLERYQIVTDSFTFKTPNIAIENIPKLIIECSNDPLLPLDLREDLKKIYPEAKVINFGNDGHIPNVSKAQEYNKTLSAFFQ